MELPLQYKRAARRFEPITAEGLTIYPIRVCEWDEWCIARPAIEAMQQSFPADMLSMPILAAMYRMDFEAMLNGRQQTGLFPRALLALSLSLRLGEGRTPEERVGCLRPAADPRDPGRLTELKFTLNGEEMHKITPVQFQRIRPIIAMQNGAEIQSEDANPELVQAEIDLAEMNAPKLDADIDEMISSVAALTGAGEETIDEWPILKLTRRAASLKRAMDYIICGIGESQGTKWKGGNPAPHPYFARVKENSAALVNLGTFQKNALGAARGE